MWSVCASASEGTGPSVGTSCVSAWGLLPSHLLVGSGKAWLVCFLCCHPPLGTVPAKTADHSGKHCLTSHGAEFSLFFPTRLYIVTTNSLWPPLLHLLEYLQLHLWHYGLISKSPETLMWGRMLPREGEAQVSCAWVWYDFMAQPKSRSASTVLFPVSSMYMWLWPAVAVTRLHHTCCGRQRPLQHVLLQSHRLRLARVGTAVHVTRCADR